MSKIQIQSHGAPKAIGSYSQAIRSEETVYLSGQIPLDPDTLKPVDGDFDAQLSRVFENLKAVTKEVGGDLDDIVKLTVYLTDLTHYPRVNEVMARYFQPPFPARAVIGVAALPLGVGVEVEGIMEIDISEYQY